MAFYLAHSNSDSAVLPRSEVPENFIPAQATARVTTFSFPLFILSGTPPGRLLKPVSRFWAARGTTESHTWKIASPGGSASAARFPFGQPRSGVRGRVYQKPHFTSSVFLRFFVQYFCTFALSPDISCELERKFIFNHSISTNGTEVPCCDKAPGSLPEPGARKYEGPIYFLRRRAQRPASASRLNVAVAGSGTFTAK